MTKFWKRTACFIVLIVLSFAFYNFMNVYKYEGYLSLTQKKVINQNYYIYVNSDKGVVQLECTKQVYVKAIISKDLQYRIYYTSNKLYPNKGQLLFIKFNDKIDNRDKNTKD